MNATAEHGISWIQKASQASVVFLGLCLGACANFDSEGSFLGLMLIGGGSGGGVGASASPGFDLQFDTALLTSETGTSTTINVMLTSQPTANVTITPTVSDSTEASLSPSALTFTPANYNVVQGVTVTGVDDGVVDGNQNYSIDFGTAASEDGGYNFQPVGSLSAINTDDDGVARVTVSPLTGLVTSELGGTAEFLVVLNTQPTLNVTVTPASSDTTEAASPAALIFTSANWNVPQKVTVTGANDNIADGTVAYTMTFTSASGDVAYNGLPVTDVVNLTNTDDDTPGVTVTPTTGLATTEGASTDNFTVVLDSEPTANVVISLTSTDTTEGTVSPASLTFTSGNWNVPQTVTVTGVDDNIIDLVQNFMITTGAAVSGDGNYNGMTVDDVSVSNADDDTAGFVVTPTVGLNTGETGTTDTFTVRLTAEPTANVVIGLTSDNTAEGTVSPASLTFTNLNWNIPQTVTVTGVDDTPPVADGAQAYNIVTAAAVTTDTDFSGLDPSDVSVTNANDDNVAFVITPATSLITTEGGGAVTFNIRLATFPADNVTLGSAGMADLIRSLDTTEASISPSSLTWTPAMWNTDQAITITGLADLAADGNQTYHIDFGVGESTGDAFYNGLAPPDSNGGTAGDYTLTNCDVDNGEAVARCFEPGVTNINTTEGGGSSTASYILTSAPTANVTVPFATTDTTEFSVSTTSMTFTSANWFTPQSITLTGVDDFQDDGDIVNTLTVGPLTSGDGAFNGQDPTDPSTTNSDNDLLGFTLSGVSGNTDENGTTATFTLRLRTQPLPAVGTVVISLTSLDTSEVTVSPGSLTFTASGGATCGGSGGNWCTNQTVTLTGVDDALLAPGDGDVTVTIQTGAAVAAGTDYNGQNPIDRTVTNLDNDKRVFLTANVYDGDLDTSNDGNPIPEADAFCAVDANHPGSGTYKALVVDGVHRNGSTTANAGDGQIDWPFTASYNYFRSADSMQIFTTNANAIFPFGTLTNNFTNAPGGATDLYWTGLNADWTTSANDCTDWTANTVVNGEFGDGFFTGSGGISNGNIGCATLYKLLCVEQ